MNVTASEHGLSLTYQMKLYQVQSWILLCWLIRLERWHSKDTVLCDGEVGSSEGLDYSGFSLHLEPGLSQGSAFQKTTYELVV